MAHVAVTSPDGDHRADERLVRDALGVAGVTAAPFAAWLDDWRLASTGTALLPARLRFSGTEAGVDFGVDVTLSPGRPLVLQGDAGLSRKGEAAGNASYYYSFTRLPTAGTLRLGGERWTVEGLAWLDREWSTSVLERGQRGWDWFALHLDDGRDLMLYRIRRDPGATPRPTDFAGTLVHPDGRRERLDPGPGALVPLAYWTDERGVDWPVRWRLSLPDIGVEGRVAAVVDDQLDRLSVRYWEGLVCLEGTAPGCGYLEMTGYGGAAGEGEREN
jgi:predicted secreted hydrolase